MEITPKEKSKQIIKSFKDKGFKKEHKCVNMAIVACDLIIQETLEEYTNDENHCRIEFYKEVKYILLGEEYSKEKTFLGYKYSQSQCKHLNVREEIAGGRRDICNDCGKTWG